MDALLDRPDPFDYLGRHIRLQAGDLIATGTPARLTAHPAQTDTSSRATRSRARSRASASSPTPSNRSSAMKPPTVFLGEMTNPELEEFLQEHQTVIVPVGSTEQHGPHGPLATDTMVPIEIARRIAPQVGAVVGPSVSYGLSTRTRLHRRRLPAHVDVRGAHRGPVRELRADGLPAHRLPQRPLRQHLRHRLRLRHAGETHARRYARLPGQLLGRHERRRGRRFFWPRPACTPTAARSRPCSPSTRRRRHGARQRRDAAVPRSDGVGGRPHGVLLLVTGSVYRATKRDVGRRARRVGRVRRALPGVVSARRSGCSTTSRGLSRPCPTASL